MTIDLVSKDTTRSHIREVGARSSERITGKSRCKVVRETPKDSEVVAKAIKINSKIHSGNLKHSLEKKNDCVEAGTARGSVRISAGGAISEAEANASLGKGESASIGKSGDATKELV